MMKRIALLSCSLLLAVLGVRADPLPGQVVIHPDNDQLLARHEGDALLLVGPGDPELYFYQGTRNSDGTRTGGDQDAILDTMIANGGNTLYTTLLHPGLLNPYVDGRPSTLEVEPAVLDQWNGWIDRMEANDIILFACLYDDDFSFVGDRGDAASTLETVTFPVIVDALEHHSNITWGVCEESSGRMSAARVDAIADLILEADDHDHFIYDHHWNWGFPYDWDEFISQDSDSVHGWAIELRRDHLNNDEPAGLHDLLLDMRVRAKTHGYALNLSEIFSPLDEDEERVGGPHGSGYLMRWTNWTAAMSGIQGVMVLWMFDDRGNRSDALLEEDLRHCRVQQEFFESTDFDTMEPHDELGLASTNFVLANPGTSYIGYRHTGSGQVGISDLVDGIYDLDWLNPATGERIEEVALPMSGDATWDPPAGFGDEVAFWLRASADQDGDGIVDPADNCLDTPNSDQADEDADGSGDACDPCPRDPLDDADLDGACADVDNCPELANADQDDGDVDGLGDACDDCPVDPDNDADGDSFCGDVDNCPDDANADQDDVDVDGTGDACDPCPRDPLDDADSDGLCANFDNCPETANPLQVDLDADGSGDECDDCPLDPLDDADVDGHCADVDNCPELANADQADLDGDALGDACDLDLDGDGADNDVDCAPADFGDPELAPSLDGLRVAWDDVGGRALLRWVPAASGMTDPEAVHEVVLGELARLHADRGFDAACARTGDATTELAHDAASDESWYYLVRAVNDCGIGPLAAVTSLRTELDLRVLPACP
ncbi:MAG: thrombospondin type 3 repeat-containing protein [Acidobacteriota bacterium]